ncbi:type II secretion system ATPase GspE, partial [bacterium]|nr:type II secretion system ATPase GspE [bacterium]
MAEPALRWSTPAPRGTPATGKPTVEAQVQSAPKSLEEILVDRGRVSPEDLRKVRKLQAERGERIERLLLDLGFVSEDDLLPVYSEVLGVPLASRKELPNDAVQVPGLNVKFLRHAKILPVSAVDGVMKVAMADPRDRNSMQGLEVATGLRVEPLLAKEKDISEALDSCYGERGDGAGGGNGDAEGLVEYLSEDEEDVDHLRDLASEAPVIRFVNVMINRAVESRASDIHIEPFENELKIRYRIDGVLHDVDAPQRRLQAAIVSRIKIMAKLNIAERRLPQDGRIKLRMMGKEIDLRVSTLPTLYGESVVLRILDRGSIVLDLGSLGFPSDTLADWDGLIVKPYGMILVTGPTGSGKTTTLYGSLNKVNSPDKKIITIEDPVEYQLNGVNQIHVKPQIGLTFANGLRSIVRQDPDVIMVGEIRDAETAEIAIQAALTGHLVFSTLHTNDAAGAVARLLEMGVEDYLLASSLLGVLAQRLVRRNCSKCLRPIEVVVGDFATEQDRTGVAGERGIAESLAGAQLVEGAGCEACSFTGYRGRAGIYELLLVDDAIRNLILKRSSADKIREEAIRLGMRTLREDGWRSVREGMTTVSEVIRVSR